MAFTPDGRRLVTGCLDTIKIWDVGSHHLIRTVSRIAPDHGRTVAVSPDGKWIACSTDRDDVEVRELASLRLKASLRTTLHGNARGVYSLAFAPDSRSLVVGRFTGRIEVWNLSTGQRKTDRDAHRSAVNGLAFSPGGRLIATGGWDNTVGLWDFAHLRLIRRIIGHTEKVTSVALSPDGNRLASGAGNEIKLWDPRCRHENPELHQKCLGKFAFTRSGELQMLVSRKDTNSLTLQELATRRVVAEKTVPSHTTAALSPDGRLVGLGTRDGKAHILDVGSGRITTTLNVDPRPAGCFVMSLEFSPDCTRLAVSSGDPAHVSVWDVPSCREILFGTSRSGPVRRHLINRTSDRTGIVRLFC